MKSAKISIVNIMKNEGLKENFLDNILRKTG